MLELATVKKTKIVIPRRRSDLLRRQRLVDAVHSSMDRRLLLVSAPAGYGKTTLLVDFASDTDIPVCWYSLDAAAQEPRVFLEHLIASVAHRFDDFGAQTLSALQSVRDLSSDGLYPVHVSLVNEVYDRIPECFALVLDDFHLVDRSDIVTGFVARLLEDAPENLCLVVASRTVPGSLPILRLTGRRQIEGIGGEDLRFTPDEVQQLVRQNYRLEMSSADAAELARDAEGWITGILLSTHSLWQGLLSGLIRTRGRATVYGYLANEVFDQQTPEVRSFLLGSSILDEMSPPLCDQALGLTDSASMLRLLEERNLFVTRLEGEELWYRYHHLFHDYLSQRLKREDAERRLQLHRMASIVFQKTGDREQAVHHLLEAGDYVAAIPLMERQAASLYRAGRWMTLTGWCETLPALETVQSPELLLFAGQAYVQQGNLERAEVLLSLSEARAREQGDPGRAGWALVERAGLLRRQGRYAQAERLALKGLRLMPQDQPLQLGSALRVVGIILGAVGRFAEARGHLERALEQSVAAGAVYNRALIHVDLAYVLEKTGALDDAMAHLEKAAPIWRDIGNPGELANVLNSLGVLYYQRGEYRRALDTLNEALGFAEKAGAGPWSGYVLSGLADVFRDVGRIQEALDYYDRALESLDPTKEGFLGVYLRAGLAEVLTLSGEPLQGGDQARQAAELARAHRSDYELGLALVAQGLASFADRPAESVSALAEATALLDRIGARRDLVRARFLLASARFTAGQRDLALADLRAAVGQADTLRARHVLQAAATWARPLLEFARRQGTEVEDLVLQPAVPPRTARVVEAEARTPLKKLCLEAFRSSRISVDGEAALTNWPRARELIFFLLAAPDARGYRREEIMSALWPDLPAAKAKSNLHSTTYRIRRALPGDPVRFVDGHYCFAPDAEVQYDVAKFERLMSQAASTRDAGAAAALYEEAIRAYGGEYLLDVYADWCYPKRDALLERWLQALRVVTKYCYANGDHAAAIEAARRWAEAEPTDEEAALVLMRSLAAQGNLGAALRQYQRLQTALADLELEPSEPLRAVYQELAAQE